MSRLAVAADLRSSGGRLMFPLMKFLAHHMTFNLRMQRSLLCVHPRTFDLYRSLFDARPIDDGRVHAYSFAGGAPAAGGELDWRRAYCFMAAKFSQRGARNNLIQ